jgi:hypothetical protein
MRRLALLLLVSGSLLLPRGSAHAQTGYDSRYYEPPGLQAPPWSAADDAWLARNRGFALAGKILTVIGVAGIVVGSAAGQEVGVWSAGLTVQTLGQYMWSIAELRGAKQLRSRGIGVTKAPGIAAVVGAVLFSPLTWIAGPIQSARIREIEEALPGYGSSAARRRERFSSHGLGLRLAF